MAVPRDSAQLVERWCEEQTPPHMRDRTRLEATVTGNKITIHECTLMREGKVDWLRVPSAQLRYDPFTRIWSLYWIDSHDRWHIVQATPSRDIEELLTEIGEDPDCLFFG